MKMSQSYQRNLLEKEIREKEKLLRGLLPFKTPGDKALFKQTEKEIRDILGKLKQLTVKVHI